MCFVSASAGFCLPSMLKETNAPRDVANVAVPCVEDEVLVRAISDPQLPSTLEVADNPKSGIE